MSNLKHSPQQQTLASARARLRASRTDGGAWRGALSTSALSTATATLALALSARAGRGGHQQLAAAGYRWLCRHQNDDGGYGDTVGSPSNISTSTVVWACLGVPVDADLAATEARLSEYLARACGGRLEPATLTRAIRARYGRDHTFSVPILMTCALGGRLGEDGWRWVPPLPFELAACPQRWFRWLSLRTVSYALPALIGIGQARHHHRPSRNPLLRALRWLAARRTLRVLEHIQPESGGYLEAAPLTSFVSMALISMGLPDHPVVERGLGFLKDTVRPDGGWPIDTNLDTWTTTLSVSALEGALDDEERRASLAWLIDQQHREVHRYTNAAPGGWAWTDLSGGVPDADDTAGALIALRHLSDDGACAGAAASGVTWLLELQNRDGGTPTFCRGWGKLPFDRSSPDLTAHALRAYAAWRSAMPPVEQRRIDRAIARGVNYLLRDQRDDGTWVPLWFGNQQAAGQENPVHGTSRVLRAVAAVRCAGALDEAWLAAGRRGLSWLLAAQDADGGFGAGPGTSSSVEETGWAVEALAEWQLAGFGADDVLASVERGAAWLSDATAHGTRFEPTPVGLYFAKLWYSEELYPVIFTASALSRAERCLVAASSRCSTSSRSSG